MEPTDFEKWCVGEMGHTVAYIMSRRRKDFFGTAGYKVSEIEVRYRAWNAGVFSRLPYQTPPKGDEDEG